MNPSPPPAPGAPTILLLPPTRRDGNVIQSLLASEHLACSIFTTMHALCAAIGDQAGMIIVSDEFLMAEPAGLIACLADQPVWSDLPVIVLSRSGNESPALSALLTKLGNVSVLERPVRLTTFISMVRSSLRARDRQYQVRDHLAERKRVEQELRASEDRLHLAVQTGKLGVWEVDLARMELTCSATCKANFGRNSEQPFTYDDLWASVHPDDLEYVQQAVQDSIQKGKEYDVEYRNRWPDGTMHMVLARGSVSYGLDGAPRKLVGVTLDITDRMVIEQRRNALLEAERNARAEAERAGRMKDEFLATLSHELRTPLNAIFGWTHILKYGPNKSAQQMTEGINVIERNARAQTQIIEDLLDMSRIISGKIRLNVEPIDLAVVIHAAIETVQPAADAKGIRIHATLGSQPLQMSGDPNRLQQVFWNLLSNAVKFTPDDGGVRLAVEHLHGRFEVAVIDSGEGIDAAFLPYVFDRFRQADATTARRHGGLGLGLAIVKQLVELHGGSVRAESTGAGHGSAFIVALPMTIASSHHDVAPAQSENVTPPPPEAANTDPDLSGITVLVVDNETDARNLVRQLLESRKATVFDAADVDEALALLQTHRPQVLVSDIGMPGQDGYSLLRRIRALAADGGGDTPAIALTAYAREEDRAAAARAGFQRHLAKPVQPEELITMVALLSRKVLPISSAT